jgi:hypothetical protein
MALFFCGHLAVPDLRSLWIQNEHAPELRSSLVEALLEALESCR